MPLQLQFRLQPTRAFDDVDPARIEPAIAALANVERFKIFDDRLADADFVTLVVVLRGAGTAHLAALEAALGALANVRVFAVDRSGTAHPLDTIPPDRLPEIAASDVPGL